MKTIYIIIATLFVGFFAKAQQSQLSNTTWILEKLIIEDTEYLFPDLPVEGGLPHPVCQIQFFNDDFHTSICNGMGGDISYSDNNITITASGMTLGGCPSGYDNYEVIYFGTFFGSIEENGAYYSNYDYQIENINDNLRLTLTNPNGDDAIYWRSTLASSNVSLNDFKIYPNPVGNSLNISTVLSKINIQLYDMSGNTVLNKKIEKGNNNLELNVSQLVSGNYMMIVKDSNDKTVYTTKIIKK